MSAPTDRDPTDLDWDRADHDYELQRDDHLALRTDTDRTQDRYENWLAGETS